MSSHPFAIIAPSRGAIFLVLPTARIEVGKWIYVDERSLVDITKSVLDLALERGGRAEVLGDKVDIAPKVVVPSERETLAKLGIPLPEPDDFPVDAKGDIDIKKMFQLITEEAFAEATALRASTEQLRALGQLTELSTARVGERDGRFYVALRSTRFDVTASVVPIIEHLVALCDGVPTIVDVWAPHTVSRRDPANPPSPPMPITNSSGRAIAAPIAPGRAKPMLPLPRGASTVRAARIVRYIPPTQLHARLASATITIGFVMPAR